MKNETYVDEQGRTIVIEDGEEYVLMPIVFE